jgi:hypothetical protein
LLDTANFSVVPILPIVGDNISNEVGLVNWSLSVPLRERLRHSSR